MSGKSQTIGDFTSFWPSQILPIYRICTRGLSQIFPIMNYLFVIVGLEPCNLGDWHWAKSIADGCRCPWRYKFEFSFVGNDRRPSQKSETRRENRNAPDSPDLSLVFICRENPRQSGILLFPDRPRFWRLMKTRNLRYPRSSGNERGQIWRIGSVSIFPTRLRFLRWSAIIRDKSKLKFLPSGTLASVGDGFRSLPIP